MKEILLNEKQIENICIDIASKLESKFKESEKAPVFIGVLKGALNFTIDLIKHIKIPLLTDYIQISSYVGTKTSGTITLKKDISLDVEGRDVVIIEDIVDSGISMNYLIKRFKAAEVKSVTVVCLIDKACARKVPVQVDYSGYVMKEPKFIVGYGLDYEEYFRNVPYIYVLDEKEIKEVEKLVNNHD